MIGLKSLNVPTVRVSLALVPLALVPRALVPLALVPLALAIAPLGPAIAQQPIPDDLTGAWIGVLDTPMGQLRIRVDFTVVDGNPAATMTSVDQGNASIPVASTTVERSHTVDGVFMGAAIALDVPMIGGGYEGTLAQDGQSIEGTFRQAGAELPLVLERMTGEEADTSRPQDPIEPYPYLAEEVSYPNPDGGHTLAGTFTRPGDGGPYPAVILISGSGPQDRDEALMGHRPFLVLADHLTRRGIAVLRFDDRGVAESTGDFAAATSRDFASDVLAGVAYLKTRDDVDAGAIGLAGHSEGGLIAPMAAVDSDDVAFIVLMAGPGIAGERILYAQGALIARAQGATEEQIARNQEQQRRLFEIVKSEPEPEAAAERLEAVVREQLASLTDAERQTMGVTDEASLEAIISAQVAQINTPWFRYFLAYDPAPVIAQVEVPVLAINGENDLQVPFEENLREIEAALQRGGNPNFEIRALPGLNHLFQHSETGSPAEYATIEETWSVEAMELIADWVLRTVAR